MFIYKIQQFFFFFFFFFFFGGGKHIKHGLEFYNRTIMLSVQDRKKEVNPAHRAYIHVCTCMWVKV